MCGQCAVDYAHTAPFVCRKCGSRGVTGFFYFLFMAWWVAFLLFTTWKARRKAMANNATLPPHIKVLVTHLQFLGMAGLVRCGWDSSLEQFFALARATVLPTEAPVSLECVIAGNTVDSSGTVAYDAVRASLLLPCRVCARYRVRPVLWITTLGGSQIAVTFIVLVPAWVALMLFWGVASATRLLYRDPVAKRKSRDLCVGSLQQTTVTLLYFAYPALCVAALRLFPCLTVQGVGTLWEGSLDVSCEAGSSHETVMLSAGVAAIVCAVLGIPVVLSFTVWRRRTALWTRPVKATIGMVCAWSCWCTNAHCVRPCVLRIPLRWQPRPGLVLGAGCGCEQAADSMCSGTIVAIRSCGSGTLLRVDNTAVCAVVDELSRAAGCLRVLCRRWSVCLLVSTSHFVSTPSYGLTACHQFTCLSLHLWGCCLPRLQLH